MNDYPLTSVELLQNFTIKYHDNDDHLNSLQIWGHFLHWIKPSISKL